eukprot:TRINITY_DN53347_c0_g1_i2.p1 TRINITY_DN53347_c0_g1~~TRINITY_DN53347_c0_g1_i2.p1  ORF type:complete len:317 (-),score=25.99 TRINITY_DN53347_c0_g1_i2:156-1106(-)
MIVRCVLLSVFLSLVHCQCDPQQLFIQRAGVASTFTGLFDRTFDDYDDYAKQIGALFTEDAEFFIDSSGLWTPRDLVLEYLAISVGQFTRGTIKNTQTPTTPPQTWPISTDEWLVPVAGRSTTTDTLNAMDDGLVTYPTWNGEWRLIWVPCQPIVKRVEFDSVDFETGLVAWSSLPNVASTCQWIQKSCTGEYEQFSDMWECIRFYNRLPKGCNNPEEPTEDFRGNSIKCRQLHLFLLPLRPDIHCAHVGKDPYPFCQDSHCDNGFAGERPQKPPVCPPVHCPEPSPKKCPSAGGRGDINIKLNNVVGGKNNNRDY